MFIKLVFILPVFAGLLFFISGFSSEGAAPAYFGAPPVIPHEVETVGRRDCLACHENGMVVNNVKSPVTPHPELVRCRQCHLNQQMVSTSIPNSFEGLKTPLKTYRQNPYAPPLIPHRTLMYTKCLVCHNNKAFSSKIVQTNHPERQNCKQCHLDLIDVKIFAGAETDSQ